MVGLCGPNTAKSGLLAEEELQMAAWDGDNDWTFPSSLLKLPAVVTKRDVLVVVGFAFP